ncbi:hypothetical protein [Brasilonema bromeliae]|uniref:Calcium-binding protein n=1 Tax=Brasilonema bromeliae SPC951 TaxID=385972 RepID=A0ABX1P8X1_9CYAN|nr:hypothetical protein [Brasilonema bromeliae SPC951]
MTSPLPLNTQPVAGAIFTALLLWRGVVVTGGKGNDILWGGTGADRFVYSSPSEGIDIIKDYSYLQGDRITISKTGFGATSTNQFSYNSITGALFFQGTQFVTLENKPADFSTSLGIELV